MDLLRVGNDALYDNFSAWGWCTFENMQHRLRGNSGGRRAKSPAHYDLSNDFYLPAVVG
jgi:hypothetical protein